MQPVHITFLESNAMKLNNIITIVATTLLCLAAVPAVLSFGGYTVVNNNNAIARNYDKKCGRAQDVPPRRQQIIDLGLVTDVGARSRQCVQLQMTDDNEDNSNSAQKSSSFTTNDDDDGDYVGSRMSKRKRVLNVFRRVFRFTIRQRRSLPTEQEEDESEEEPTSFIDGTTTIIEEEDNAVVGVVVDDVDTVNLSTTTTIPISSTRQAMASPITDLSGTWSPIVTPSFKSQYDDYLKNCSQSFVFRKVVVNGIEYQRETIRQLDQGQSLEIIAQNPAGNWNRTLVASDINNPLNTTIVDPDKDTVNVEAWWEDNGTKHKSVLRGKPRVNGGVFETVRYLDKEDENVLVCESTFLPNESEGSSSSFKHGHIIWRFRRVA